MAVPPRTHPLTGCLRPPAPYPPPMLAPAPAPALSRLSARPHAKPSPPPPPRAPLAVFRYYEDSSATLLRDRFVVYSDSSNYSANALPPDWYGWINHINDFPPTRYHYKQPVYALEHCTTNVTGEANRRLFLAGRLYVQIIQMQYGVRCRALHFKLLQLASSKLAAVHPSEPTGTTGLCTHTITPAGWGETLLHSS
jgi:hypothetical protein